MPITLPPPPPALLRALTPAEVRPAPVFANVASSLIATAAPMTAPAIGAQERSTVEASVEAGDVLERGDAGEAVRDLQRRLGRVGHPVGVDGSFGPATEAAVTDFQQARQVSPTGRVGPTTALALRVAEARRADIPIVSVFRSVGPGQHLAAGDTGLEVQTLQRLLTDVGHPVAADGAFGAGTRNAVQDFQGSEGIARTGEVGPTTLQALDRRVDSVAAAVVQQLALPAGYGSLNQLALELTSLDSRYSPATSDGRSTLALALAIGGTEVYGRDTTGTDFFTRLGGTGNNMLGFAQFNLAFHRDETQTPRDYTRYLADILNGQDVMPNSGPAANHARALSVDVSAGRVRNGSDLRAFMTNRGFGGSNWQGIDDGWGRTPGLADALVRFLSQNSDGTPRV